MRAPSVNAKNVAMLLAARIGTSLAIEEAPYKPVRSWQQEKLVRVTVNGGADTLSFVFLDAVLIRDCT
jgi:hypothetical protein